MRRNLTEAQRERLLASYLTNGYHATVPLAKSYGVQPKYLSKLARIAGPQRNYKDKGPPRGANERDAPVSRSRKGDGLVRKRWNQREASLARSLLDRCASEREVLEALGCTKNSAKMRLARIGDLAEGISA